MDTLNAVFIVVSTGALFYMIGLRHGSKERDQLRRELRSKINYLAMIEGGHDAERSDSTRDASVTVRYNWERPSGNDPAAGESIAPAKGTRPRRRTSVPAKRPSKARRLSVTQADSRT